MEKFFRPLALKWATPPEWAEVALRDFDAFLLDHAACERKASAVGMSFVVRYPDRALLIDPMISFAREELEHFHQVYRLVEARGLMLEADAPDNYVNRLMALVRNGREERFLDRLIVSSVIEARGHERLHLITEALTDPSLKSLYQRLTRAEDRHKDLFVDLALNYFSEEAVTERLEFFLDHEAEAIQAVPFRSAIH